MKRSASLVRKTSNVSKEALERLEKNEQRREDTPSQLALSDVHVADKVFQWRLPDEDVLADALFVQDLWTLLRLRSNLCNRSIPYW
jgi:hypothetical protein